VAAISAAACAFPHALHAIPRRVRIVLNNCEIDSPAPNLFSLWENATYNGLAPPSKSVPEGSNVGHQRLSIWPSPHPSVLGTG